MLGLFPFLVFNKYLDVSVNFWLSINLKYFSILFVENLSFCCNFNIASLNFLTPSFWHERKPLVFEFSLYSVTWLYFIYLFIFVVLTVFVDYLFFFFLYTAGLYSNNSFIFFLFNSCSSFSASWFSDCLRLPEQY